MSVITITISRLYCEWPNVRCSARITRGPAGSSTTEQLATAVFPLAEGQPAVDVLLWSLDALRADLVEQRVRARRPR